MSTFRLLLHRRLTLRKEKCLIDGHQKIVLQRSNQSVVALKKTQNQEDGKSR